MLKAAAKELVDIYAKMDPEAAAKQLAELDTTTATSVIRQLSPRGASAILNVMEAKQAARLAKAIASATVQPKKENGS
jgi:flagellar motility protein MotE (MotC chaperone)